jgi:uncharacterized protein
MAALKRFLLKPKQSSLLLGPRGTGKSTWLRGAFPEALWLDLLDPELQRSYLARPERLRELLHAAVKPDSTTTLVIDEIQKVPALLDVLHDEIEQRARAAKPPLLALLTGSSARKLRRGASNLLGGRLQQMQMHPYLAAELGEAFDLSRALRIGLTPLIWHAAEPEHSLSAYASLYLREEVQAEALVRDVAGFARFLEAISFSHGAPINLASVSRECQVSRKTVDSYFEILHDLLLCFSVPVFTKRAQRQLVAHEKFYFFDAGVYRSLRPRGVLDRAEEIEGGALEGLVAQHLRAYLDYRRQDEKLYYWRTKSGSEIDFIIYGASFVAIEVKRSTSLHSKDTRALREFHNDYPEAKVALLYLGRERLKIGDVDCIPLMRFLQRLHPEIELNEVLEI